MKIEIAKDQIEAKEFVSWLNNHGYDAYVSDTTGNYIDGVWTSTDQDTDDFMRNLWDQYCNE